MVALEFGLSALIYFYGPVLRKKQKNATTKLLTSNFILAYRKKTCQITNNNRSRDLVNLIREFFVRETNEVKRV